ncbi:MAG: cAMP-binding protein [Rhodospirillaceae bacterium]|nr:cAMP-binding protein [Rhodospirillaceae bacterium]OUT76529.1 MAG: hypothetical protein CBB83_10825 [Rhodospirillaceae bacterium TMED23]|tara:strand:- start:8443 stop:8868 length:426 start_codon:yes stop_codon:yes gene_type:complete
MINEQPNTDNEDSEIQIPLGSEKRTFKEGKYIFREGEIGDLAFVVLSGTVCISRLVGEKDVVIGTVGKGGMFGEMALIDNAKRMGSARASGGIVEVLVIDRNQFKQKLINADPFQRALINILTGHVRKMAEHLSKSNSCVT